MTTLLTLVAVGNANSGCNPKAAKKRGNKCGRPPGSKTKKKKSSYAPGTGPRKPPPKGAPGSAQRGKWEKWRKRENARLRKEAKQPKTGPPPGGKLTVKEKAALKKKGMVIDLKKKGKKFKQPKKLKNLIVEQHVERTKPGRGRKAHDYTVTTLKPAVPKHTPKAGTPASRKPPKPKVEITKPHKLHSKFEKVYGVYIKKEKRKSWVYDADTGILPMQGTSVFINAVAVKKKQTMVWVHEVKRSMFGHIEETKNLQFNTMKKAKEFLQDRFGIKLGGTRIE